MCSESGARNVVLVHGGFVDGPGSQAEPDLPTQDGDSRPVLQAAIFLNLVVGFADFAHPLARLRLHVHAMTVLAAHLPHLCQLLRSQNRRQLRLGGLANLPELGQLLVVAE